MLSESDKRLLKYVGVGEKSTQYSLIRLNISGQINQSRYYLADLNDANANPINGPGEDGYLKHLRTMSAINLLEWTRLDGSKTTQIYRSNIPLDTAGAIVDTKATHSLNSSASNYVFKGDLYADNKNFIEGINIVPMSTIDGISGVGFRASSHGYTWNTRTSDALNVSGKPYCFMTPDGSTKSYNTDVMHSNEYRRATTVDWPDISSNNAIGECFLLLAREGYCRVEDFITNIPLGCSWTSWSTNTASRQLSHPEVPGTRRVVLFINHPCHAGTRTVGGDGYYTLALTGYIWGEGDDVYAYATGSLSGSTVTKKLAFGLMPSSTKVTVGRASSISRVVSAYPLDGVAMLNNSIVGQLTRSDSKTYSFDNSSVNVVDYNFECDYATGSISAADYYEYLTTGFGIYTPRTTEAAQKALESWSSLTAGLYYKIHACDLSKSKVTLKDTEYYEKYAKMRARACKDNNYMDLMYNQVYTMKQVQNKLESLVSRSVWMQNGASKSSLADGASVKWGGVLTISASTNPGKFSAVAVPSGGSSVNLEFALTEAGISSMLDAYPGFTINDPSSVITSVMGSALDGSNLTDVNSALSFYDRQYDLRPATFIAGAALCYDDMVLAGAASEVKAALLASQVTDFAKFEGTIQRWLNDFSHNNVVNMLQTTRTAFKEIDVTTIVS